MSSPSAGTSSKNKPGGAYESIPGVMQPSHALSSFDAQFLAAETGPILSNYCGVFIFDPPADGGRLDRDRVIELVESRIDRIPVLRWRLRKVPLNLDHPLFVDGEVEVSEHVFEQRIDAPGGDVELAVAGARIMEQRMDRSRPLWEMHVLAGLEADRVGVGLKFHHAMADALGASTIAGLLFDPNPEGERSLPPPVPREKSPGAARLALRGLGATLAHPARAGRAIANSAPQIDQVPMMRTLPGIQGLAAGVRRFRAAGGRSTPDPGPQPSAPRMRFNGPLTSGRAVAFGTVTVAHVKAAKERLGISFNDVVMAAVGGGLRAHLSEGGELPAEPLMAFVPANVRAAHDASFGNAISSFVVPVPTHLADGDARATFASGAMTTAKSRHAQTSPTLMVDANSMIPPVVFRPLAAGLLRLLGTKLIDPPLNLLVSNVPGPQSTVYFCGAKLHSIRPMSLIFPGALLNITVISYKDRLEIGMVGDRDALADVQPMCEAVASEFERLGGG